MASSSSSSTYYRRRYTKEEICRMTHCNCSFPIYEQVAWTPQNPGRRFKACPTRNKQNKCDVYGFVDDELPWQYYKELVMKLYKENHMLKSNLLSVSHQEDGQQQVARNKESDVAMEMIYKELKELKVKGKMYDIALLGSTSVLLVMLVIIVPVIVSLSSDVSKITLFGGKNAFILRINLVPNLVPDGGMCRIDEFVWKEYQFLMWIYRVE